MSRFRNLPGVVARAASLLSAAVGIVVLAGWSSGLPSLTRIVPGAVSMAPNAAVAFLLCGAALWLRAGGASPVRDRASRAAAVAVGLLAAATLAEYVSGADLRIDELLFRDPARLAGDPPGRMAAITALGFLAIASALLAWDRARRPWLSDAFAGAAGSFGSISLTDYAYGVSSFVWLGNQKGMAVLTASGFVALAAGILIGNSNGAFSRLLLADSPGSALLRRLLPVALVVPVLSGLVGRFGQRADWYGPGFGIALAAVTDAVVMAAVLVFVAERFRRAHEEAAAALRASEEQLLESEDRFKYVFEHSAIGMTFTFPDGEVQANEAFAAMLGYAAADLDGKRFQTLTHPEDVAPSLRAFESILSRERESVRFVKRYVHRDGSIVWADVSSSLRRGRDGGPLYFVTSATDITERRRWEKELAHAQEQLRQAMKMEAVGRLAGGVAHDFNNLLTVIRGYAEMLEADLSEEADGEAVGEILRASDRAAALTRQLLAFSRRQAFEMRVLDLRAVVQGAEKLLRRVIGENVALDVVVPADPAVVRADAGQIELVLMNLSVNARDAMPKGGRLSIVLRNETMGASESFAFEAIPPGRYVSVAVTDTGSGMDGQTLTHLFEPFFTTKERGQGTGLGLATAFGIVKQSGGYFEVSTSLGAGSTFRILLPEAAGAAQEPEAAAATVTGGAETILLVEDEPAVRDLTRRLLERNGYRVLPANDAAHALSVASRHDGPIHLLLTDLVMPGHEGSGVDLARAFASLRPATAVSFMSGYSYDVLATQGIVEMEGRLLQKPFREAELLAHVRKVLDAPRSRAVVVA